MTTSPKQISIFTEDESTSSAAGFRASLTQQQENDLVKKMIDTSGQKCLEQFEKFNQVGSWAKTFSALLIGTGDWFSTRCKLTWSLRGTTYNRMYFQLQASTLRTDETGFGLLLTPTSVMTDETPEKMRERAEKNGYNNGTKYGSLLSQVKYLGVIPTPTANDGKNGANCESQAKRSSLTGWSRRMLCTPTAQASRGNTSDKRGKGNLTDQIAEMNLVLGKTSQLNPRFEMEMMGFPADWTELPFLNGETNQLKPEATQ